MMHCQICNAYFDAPVVRKGTDRAVGEGFRYREELCPVCGQPYIERAAVCGKCGGYMPEGKILCKPCRENLRMRFLEFLSGLTDDEEEQLDIWLDGRSVKDICAFV